MLCSLPEKSSNLEQNAPTKYKEQDVHDDASTATNSLTSNSNASSETNDSAHSLLAQKVLLCSASQSSRIPSTKKKNAQNCVNLFHCGLEEIDQSTLNEVATSFVDSVLFEPSCHRPPVSSKKLSGTNKLKSIFNNPFTSRYDFGVSEITKGLADSFPHRSSSICSPKSSRLSSKGTAVAKEGKRSLPHISVEIEAGQLQIAACSLVWKGNNCVFDNQNLKTVVTSDDEEIVDDTTRTDHAVKNEEEYDDRLIDIIKEDIEIDLENSNNMYNVNASKTQTLLSQVRREASKNTLINPTSASIIIPKEIMSKNKVDPCPLHPANQAQNNSNNKYYDWDFEVMSIDGSISCATGKLMTALGIKRNEKEPNKRKVRFGMVHVRVYERILGDNPSCDAHGPSISIGWEYFPLKEIHVDDWERGNVGTRKRRRYKRDSCGLILTGRQRCKLAFRYGYTYQEITDNVREVRRVQQQRLRTASNVSLGIPQIWEEAIETARKKMIKALVPTMKYK